MNQNYILDVLLTFSGKNKLFSDKKEIILDESELVSELLIPFLDVI
jgi:hypothetical protein